MHFAKAARAKTRANDQLGLGNDRGAIKSAKASSGRGGGRRRKGIGKRTVDARNSGWNRVATVGACGLSSKPGRDAVSLVETKKVERIGRCKQTTGGWSQGEEQKENSHKKNVHRGN